MYIYIIILLLQSGRMTRGISKTLLKNNTNGLHCVVHFLLERSSLIGATFSGALHDK